MAIFGNNRQDREAARQAAIEQAKRDADAMRARAEFLRERQLRAETAPTTWKPMRAEQAARMRQALAQQEARMADHLARPLTTGIYQPTHNHTAWYMDEGTALRPIAGWTYTTSFNAARSGRLSFDDFEDPDGIVENDFNV